MTRTNLLKNLLATSGLLGLMTTASLPGVALAATAAAVPPASATAVEEVIVTAQRKSERLLDVPISVTDLTGGEIKRRDVTSLSDLQTEVPGLRIVDTGVGQQRIALRGISQYLGLPTVGNYLDEVSVNSFGAGSGLDIRLLDMDRIEVLRGPQPTLYGDESMGGTIRYVTKSPDLHTYGGTVEGEVGSVDHGGAAGRVNAAVNVPIIEDKLAVRLVAGYEDLGSWIDNPTTKGTNDTTITTYRGKILYKPIDRLTLSLLVLTQRADQASANYSDKTYHTFETNLLPANDRYTITNFVASYDAGPFTVLNTFGSVDRRSRSISDSAAFYNELFGAPLISAALGSAVTNYHAWTEEARLVSNGSGPLRYTFGGLYTQAEDDGLQVGTAVSVVPALQSALAYTLPFQTTSKSYAAYGTVGYDLTSRLGFDIGGRYFHDERSPDGIQTGDFSSFNPRFSVQYKITNDGLIYADVAKGFRSGGFNTVAPTDTTTPKTYGPETLYTYEIGAKQEFFKGRLLTELAGYYNNYTNIQATLVQPNGNSAQTNAGKASGYGADLTVRGRATEDLSLSVTTGYVDMHYDTTTVDRKSGEPLDMTPKWTWSLAGDYTPQLNANARLNLHADYGYTDKAQLTLHSASFNQMKFTESRAILNARIGIVVKTCEVYLFADNLTGEARIVNPDFGGYFQPIYTKPREFGVGLKASF